MVANPDLSTLVELPWEPDVACCLADLEREGAAGADRPARPRAPRRGARSPSSASPRRSAPSSSSSCWRPTATAAGRRHVDNLSMVYTVGPQADPQGVMQGAARGAARRSASARSPANHEYMNSQYEINLREATPLAAADNAFRFKAAVKDYAAQRGLLATFMGKPFNDQGGSGTHMHVSLERDGANCMGDDGHDDRPLGRAAPLRRRAARPRAGADGLSQPDDQRLPPDPPGQPRPHARQLGPQQPHDVRPHPARARRGLPARDPGRRRRRQPATSSPPRSSSPASTACAASSIAGRAARGRHLHPARGRAGRRRCRSRSATRSTRSRPTR